MGWREAAVDRVLTKYSSSKVTQLYFKGQKKTTVSRHTPNRVYTK